MANAFGMKACRVVDLGDLAYDMQMATRRAPQLAELTEKLLKMRLPKTGRLINWDNKLSESDKEYAALDAAVGALLAGVSVVLWLHAHSC